MSERDPIQIVSPEGARLIGAVVLVYPFVRPRRRWIAADSERLSGAASFIQLTEAPLEQPPH
jgi:hypothetical protein